MARIRTLKPEFWADEKLALMVPITRLVFLGLVSQADDAGRLVDNVKLIDGLLFPFTDDSSAESLTELANLGRIVRYRSASGQPLIQIVNWDKHQKVKNPSQYNLPAPSSERIQEPSVESGESGSTVGAESNAPTVCRISPISDPPPPTVLDGGGRAALMDEMKGDLEAYAEVKYPDPVKRHSFVAGARGLIAGEDSTSWQDGYARSAPWEDRPRIFRLALDRLASGESHQLRGAIKWATAQQIDPDRVRTSNAPKPGTEAAAVRSEYPRQQHGGSTGGLALVGATKPEPSPMVDFDGERVSRWTADNHEQAERIRHAIRMRVARGDSPAKSAQAIKAWADAEYRKAVLERIREEAAA